MRRPIFKARGIEDDTEIRAFPFGWEEDEAMSGTQNV